MIGREIRGVECRCDRCGTHKFYNVDCLINPVLAIEMDGWKKRLNKDLCRECAGYFDAMVEKFMNEIIYK